MGLITNVMNWGLVEGLKSTAIEIERDTYDAFHTPPSAKGYDEDTSSGSEETLVPIHVAQNVNINFDKEPIAEADRVKEIDSMRELLGIMKKQVIGELSQEDVRNELQKHASEWEQDMKKLIGMIQKIA